MPKIQSLRKVLILGSGPIVIGQACEFDYSGTQACKALMKEGLEVILINSNPATIMTYPDLANRVYIEPLTVPFVEKILEIDYCERRVRPVCAECRNMRASSECLERRRRAPRLQYATSQSPPRLQAQSI